MFLFKAVMEMRIIYKIKLGSEKLNKMLNIELIQRAVVSQFLSNNNGF